RAFMEKREYILPARFDDTQIPGVLPTVGYIDLTIDVQKMNWKFSTGVHEQTGVSLQRHCGHNCTGGYTREHQNTGQFCDGQSLAHQVAAGLSKRRCAFGAADDSVDRPAGAPRAHGGAVRALGPQRLLSLRLAAGLSPPRPG